ncbi:unnamed protein product [Sphagnum jensenii]|uniref:Histidine kinase n=1 Tax=Sphagnum jensenii TaxID=128206 RepID=A0ABP0WTL6_9BRYO
MLSLEMRSETYQWTSTHSEEPGPKSLSKICMKIKVQGSKLRTAMRGGGGTFLRKEEEEEKRRSSSSDATDTVEGLPRPFRNLIVSRVVIVVTVAVLVGLLTISTWYFTHSYPKTAVANLSESLRLEILLNTAEILDEIFAMNTYGVMALANLMEKDFMGDDFSLKSFMKIRNASWSVFAALPTITSLGVAAVNGLTAVYLRGSMNASEGTLLFYSNQTITNPTYFKEVVSDTTGDSVGLPVIYEFGIPIQHMQWFQEALTVPLNNLTWTIGRSQISKSCTHIYSGNFAVLDLIMRMLKRVLSSCIQVGSFACILILFFAGGSVFISDQQGSVLFSSEPRICQFVNKSECETTPLHQSSVLNHGKEYLQSQMDLAQLVNKEMHVADVSLNKKRYSIDSWPYSFRSVSLAVVVMIPRHSFWGPMDYHTRITWISLPLLSLGVIIIGCSLIYLLVEQVQAEEKLRTEIQRQSEAKRRAEASRDAKTNFLSSMSHELRTPMACIIGLLDMLLTKNLSSEHEGSIRQIHRCATSLVALLNSALDITKVESGKLVLEKAPFDLEAELSALIDVFSVQCDNKGLSLALQLADDVPRIVVGDSARTMQVFTNLLGNSIKFTSKGRILVRGRLTNPDSNGQRRRSFGSFSLDRVTDTAPTSEIVIVFEVDDTGPGIDPALWEKVFENFVQGDASTTRIHGGTGLGLGIVRSLVQLMGGKIRIVEKSGPGSLFQFTLCFDSPLQYETVPFQLSPLFHGAEVILGIPDGDCRAGAVHWLENEGLTVHQVETWEHILQHLRAINCSSKHHKRDAVEVCAGTDFLQESGFLTGAHKHCLDAHGLEKLDLNEWQTIRQRDLLVIWIVASNTPEPVKAALDSVCNSILVRKPLHAARFKELFQQIAQEEGDPIPITKLEKSPIVLSSNVIHYVRQQEWGDPYDCKTELPYAPSTNHVQQCYGQQHPSATATATAPAEKDSWQTPSEPKLASAVDSTPDLACISLEEEQSSQSSRTVCKTVTRNCRSRRKLSVSKGVDSLSRPLDKLDILVAEDNPLLRKLAVAMLRRLGATTHEASNGKEALEAVMIRVQGGERSFHCILMDCQMPVMDGYEACMALRAFENEGIQRTCIIALTANAMASDEQKCLNAGMDAFLTKPINEEYMVQIILRTVCPDTQSVS